MKTPGPASLSPRARALLAAARALAARTGPRQARFQSIRARLVFLVLVAELPLLVLIAHAAREQVLREGAAARELVFGRAQVMAARIDDHLAAIDALLGRIGAGVAEGLAAGADSADRFRSLALGLPPHFRRVVAIAADGALIGSSDGGPVAEPEVALARAAIATRRLAANGPVPAGPGRWTTVVARPTPAGAIAATIDLDSLERFLAVDQMPERSLVTVLDERSRVLARSAEKERWIGRIDGSPARWRARRERAGAIECNNADGEARLTGYAMCQRAEWLVCACVPRQSAFAAVDRGLRHALLLGGASFTGTLALGLFIGDRIARPIRRLADEAAALTAGAGGRLPEIAAPCEVRRVAHAFNNLLGSLEGRDAALRRNEAQLRTLISNLPGLVYRCRNDADYTIEYVSDGMLELTGCPPVDFVERRRDFASFIHPDDRARVWDAVQAAVAAGRAYELVYRIIAVDGREKWVWERGLGIRGAEGTVIALEGFVTDITARHLAEAALRESQARMQLLVRVGNIGLWDWDLTTDRVYFSPEWKRHIGYAADELREEPDEWLGRLHPDDRGAADQRLAEVRAGRRQECELEYRLRHKAGAWRSILCRAEALCDASGRPMRLIGCHVDLTARKHIEDEVQRQAAFAHFNPNPVLELSAEGEILYSNAATLEMARTLGRAGAADIVPPHTREIVRDCLASGKPLVRLEVPVEQRILSWSFFPVGARPVVHCYAGDITERKRLEEQFRQAQKMDAIGQLSAGVAHDFNNLLTVIQGHASLIRSVGGLPADAGASLGEIARAAVRAAALTRQLLTFSRKQVMELADLDANAVVAEMSNMVGRILGEDVKLEVGLAASPLMIRADSGMIDQVIMNLVVNARDAMPGGGRLTIAVAAAELSAADVAPPGGRRAGSFVHLSVRDTGAGIAPEILPRIFEPFFTTKVFGKGTGLGLATVYGIVQQHEGWIEVQSEVGRGTTFHVYLPRQIGTSPVRVIELPAARAAVPGWETILVVDDEPHVRALIELVLVTHGYRVRLAATGREALERWSGAEKTDLLLTDLVMPDALTGWDLAAQLTQSSPGLRVVFMSGYNPDLGSPRAPLREGVNYLQKPFDVARLTRTVRASLDHQGAG